MAQTAQRPPAEVRYAEELARLAEGDTRPRPRSWKLSPHAVRSFILGDPDKGCAPKYVGNASLVDRAMVSLATQRGLILVGEPGTAKSLLSELLCAAICGDSTLVIQGGASTTEDQIKYGWNYAMLLNQGPSRDSLVPAPLFQAMEQGKIVRFEEITRCPQEVQDCLLSMLSDRVMSIPELDEAPMLYAQEGFNLIATANTRDRGVNEMSAALKRRLNFETVFPIADLDTEIALVQRETGRLLADAGVPETPPEDLLEVLVKTFRDLRDGKGEGERLSTVMSTAEAVSVGVSLGVTGYFIHGRAPHAGDLLECLAGTAIKDDPEDRKRLRRYLDHTVAKRSGAQWKAMYQARAVLPK